MECDEDWNARIAQGLLMQRVGLYWSKNSQRGARTVDSMCSAMENLKLQGYGGVGSEGAPYRFWNLYVRVVFYDAFMLGHAEDWPELTQLAIEEANPGWRSAV